MRQNVNITIATHLSLDLPTHLEELLLIHLGHEGSFSCEEMSTFLVFVDFCDLDYLLMQAEKAIVVAIWF